VSVVGKRARPRYHPGRRGPAANSHLRFSPRDVAEERIVTGRVIRRLQGEFRHRVALDAVFWEHEPLVATDTFQTQIPKPSEDCSYSTANMHPFSSAGPERSAKC
jgi:hypothetical protein